MRSWYPGSAGYHHDEGLQPGKALTGRVRPEDAFTGDIKAALAPVMENLALGFHIAVGGQSAVLELGVPGADGLAVLALRNEDVDVDRVTLLELGDHGDEPVNPPLGQSGLPFLRIDHVEHRLTLHLDAGRKQVALRVAREAVLCQILIPQRAMLVGVEHVEVQADRGVVAPGFADEPPQTVQRGGILRAFQAGIHLVPGGKAVVVASLLPTDEVNDLGNAAGQVIGLPDHLERLLERAEHIVRLLEHRQPGEPFHRFAFHAQEKFQHQRLVIIATERSDPHIGGGLELPAAKEHRGFEGGDASRCRESPGRPQWPRPTRRHWLPGFWP